MSKEGQQEKRETRTTMRCIKGEMHPLADYFTTVNTLDNPLIASSVQMSCPLNHTFTLEEALAAEILTPDEGALVMQQARRTLENFGKQLAEAERPENFPVNEEIVRANLSCVRCGQPAKTSASGKNEERKTRTVLCLQCRADWYHNDNGKVWDVASKTRGKSLDLFWDGVFASFVDHRPSLTKEEAVILLAECRKQAKEKKKKRTR